MPKNELVPGEPRIGWLIDGNAETDSIAVMLRDTGVAIDLTIPLKGMSALDDPYGRWWSFGMSYGDDPDRTRYRYRPPSVLLMSDARGPVVLVGCRSTSSTYNLQGGEGHIVANFAVLGGRHLKYDKIDGCRTEIPALAIWSRLSSMVVEVGTDETHRVTSAQMNLVNSEPVPLSRRMNLAMDSSWRTEQPVGGGFIAHEGVELETSVGRPRAWEDHLQSHFAVLELISLAAWIPFGISSVKVRRKDDPERSAAGQSMGGRWLEVVTHRLPNHEPWVKTPSFLFPYKEVGRKGISRWFRLRRDYGRMMGPLLNILRSDNPWGQSSLVQSGIALEMLGYMVDVRKNRGGSLNRRGQMNFKPGLRVLLEDMEVKPFSDTEDWIDRADAAYMGAKHPDRSEPDSLVQLNTLRENILILRFWIGLQLGVKPQSLLSALELDPLAHEFVPMDRGSSRSK